MGCVSSKRIKATADVDVYRPLPSSFAVFDINDVEEPWLKGGDVMQDNNDEKQDEKIKEKEPRHMPPPLLEKLNDIDEAPRTWDEVSKALEDLKPTLNNPSPKPAVVAPPPEVAVETHAPPKPKKSASFHTLEELESKLSPKPVGLNKTVSMKTGIAEADPVQNKPGSVYPKPELKIFQTLVPESQAESTRTGSTQTEIKPVRENIFLIRDRMEREKDGKAPAAFIKRDPLSDFPEKCPPGGADTVVVYTTSLGGIRRTFEDCNNIRAVLESHRVVFDERDVSLHAEFRSELRELLGEGFGVPRLFVKGRYVGGGEEVVTLNEAGRLGRILSWARVERGAGRIGCECEGCGGARFVPCLDCGGSCKIVNGDKKERCGECNENGLVHCPICH